ncbi:hypothetical protein C8J57DRAFT_1249479 [Mycena rebaudengoi]|nr:hypothetical protein C8J57DRAFT_1249479 [Mycena rebaudengoi]
MPLAHEFSSPLSDPPPSLTKSINPLLQSGLMTEDVEMGAIGCKRRVQERRVAPECILQRRLMLWFVCGEAHDHVKSESDMGCVIRLETGELGVTYVPYINFPYRLPPVPVTAPTMEPPGYPQYRTCSARPSKNCLALRRDGAVHGTAVTSTRLSSDISMGYSILDLSVTLKLYQDPKTPKAVK